MLVNTVNSRNGGHIFLNICRMCINSSEQGQRQRSNTSRDCNCLGTNFVGIDLLSWSYLWCSFQSCCYYCFCYHKEVSIVTGQHYTQSFFSIKFIFVYNNILTYNTKLITYILYLLYIIQDNFFIFFIFNLGFLISYFFGIIICRPTRN